MSTESFDKPYPAPAGTVRQPPLAPASAVPPSPEGTVRPVGQSPEMSAGTSRKAPGDLRSHDVPAHPASSADSERSLEGAGAPGERSREGAAAPRERSDDGAATRERSAESPAARDRSREGAAASRERSDEGGAARDRSEGSDSERSEASEGNRGPSEKASGAGHERSEDAARGPTILVRGETLRDASNDDKGSTRDGAAAKTDDKAKADDKEKAPERKVSEAKLQMQSRLPALDDDADVGVQKEQLVIRDGKPDLRFNGTLIASAAPATARKGKWEELRIYETSGGTHVFSRVTRTLAADEEDRHEAEIFEPSPSSMPSQLLRSARELTRTRPLMWTDAAVKFFGYEPLAKELYRKLGDQFDEHIS